jgi:uncharacterized integral membrane protein
MIDPQAVILQVEQGKNPTTWQVFRGKDFRFVQSILVGVFIILFSIFIIQTVGERLLRFPLLFTTFPHIAPAFPYIVAGIVIIAARFSYAAWAKAARQKDSLLVLMPDGLVQCTNYHLVEKREYKTVFYPDCASMTLRRIDSFANSNSLMNINYFIVIIYTNGQEEQWQIDIRFGDPKTMADKIISAYEKYRAK